LNLSRGSLLLILVALGCARHAPPAPPEDQTLTRNSAAGQNALRPDRPAEAAAQFEAARKQAEARDALAGRTGSIIAAWLV
jgi:hypothetical protein